MDERTTDPGLVQKLQRRIEQLTRLMELNNSVFAQLDLNLLLQKIVDTVTQVVDAQLGGLLVLGDDERHFQIFRISGLPDVPRDWPTGAGVLGLPYREGVSLRLDDVRRHPQALGFPPGHTEIGPFLSVPLKHERRCLGALFVGNAPGGAFFSADDEGLLQAFADRAAIAIENARLHAQVQELARLQERQRIAQSLHDTLAQMLFSIGLQAKQITQIAPDEPTRRRAQTIVRLAGRSSDELRTAIFALRGPYLPEAAGLIELLQEQVAEFQAQDDIAATLFVSPEFPSLAPLVGEAVYRIVCESLSNVRKHAHASAVMVSLHCDQDTVTVTIQDDGVGLVKPMPLDADDGALHFGVATMRQLAAQAQGDLVVANNEDQGVVVRARFPLPQGCNP
jgi:signal transduction histidine kinase